MELSLTVPRVTGSSKVLILNPIKVSILNVLAAYIIIIANKFPLPAAEVSEMVVTLNI